MNWKWMWQPFLAAFTFIVAFDWLWHGWVMKAWYADTAQMWRTPGSLENHWQWLILGQALMAFMLAWIFTKGYEGKGWWQEGWRFGWLMGLFLAAREVMTFGYMPVEWSMWLGWVAGALLTGLGAGLLIAWWAPQGKAA